MPAAAQEILEQPICFTIINKAPYGVLGDVKTAQDHTDAGRGEAVTYTATFKLKEGETNDVCTTGPLLEGNRVRITLRTLVPIFECKTMIYQGAQIVIRGRYNKAEYKTETWAECL